MGLPKKTPITTARTFPANATKLTSIPQGFNCNYTISIPVDSFKNNVKVGIVNIDTGAEYNYGPTSGSLAIVTTTNMSQLLIDLKFINVAATYTPRNFNTGQPASLQGARVSALVFAASTPNEKVFLTTCFNYSNPQNDPVPWFTFVYDGKNTNAPLIGTLNKGIKSSGQYLTIVNPYQSTMSDSYLIANDLSKLSQFDIYSCWSLGKQFQYSFSLTATKKNAYTFLAMYNDEIYINKLAFGQNSIGSASFSPLSPTTSTNAMLTYRKNTTNCLPQLIPATMTTLVLQQDNINLNISLDRGDYNQPFVGRCGYLYSPSEWDGRQKAGFSFYLDDSSVQYTFQTAVQELKLTAPGENLQIWSRTTSATVPSNLTYINTLNNQPLETLVGNTLNVVFNSNTATSMTKVYFNVQKSSFSATFGGFFLALVCAMKVFI
ncbi:unnamed protein product [Caenorhabditis auriculariae]|uniref:CUB-like domain-containing protein n=1 Tax=Caenorhabditis auriculariae TaxID=2777116 RepID=A0A8S1HU80_9PELO|nr:unnamed protein product [Caenorhabditis auriculariae]